VTERRPPGTSFESWIDRQIREATERGEFDNLPGTGKPIPGQGQPDDELWWVKDFMRREGLPTETLLPTSLRLRKDVERLPETVARLHSEKAVLAAVAELNARIRSWLLAPSEPLVHLAPVDADEVLAQWRAARETRSPARALDDPTPRPRVRWWRRRR